MRLVIKAVAVGLLVAAGIVQGFEVDGPWALVLLVLGIIVVTYAYSGEDDGSHNPSAKKR